MRNRRVGIVVRRTIGARLGDVERVRKKLSISFEKWPEPSHRTAARACRSFGGVDCRHRRRRVAHGRVRAIDLRQGLRVRRRHLPLARRIGDVIVNASVPALVALRGADLGTDPAARLDRDQVRALYDTAVTEVTRVSRPWRRQAAVSCRSGSTSPTPRAVSRPRRSPGRRTSSVRRTASTSTGRPSARPRCGRGRCRTSDGTAASSSRSGSTCRAGSSVTTPAISRPTSRATSPAATSWPGSSS